jgi:hypothetical protein
VELKVDSGAQEVACPSVSCNKNGKLYNEEIEHLSGKIVTEKMLKFRFNAGWSIIFNFFKLSHFITKLINLLFRNIKR